MTYEPEDPGPTEHILQFFAYGHLPQSMQEVSRLFCHLADKIVGILPRNPERTVALRKLLEAKDAAVRARIANPPLTDDDEYDAELRAIAKHRADQQRRWEDNP